MKEIRTYREFTAHEGMRSKLRAFARRMALRASSFGRDIGRSSGWIAFPYYHHVFDDERKGFERQLKHLRNFGEFISMDRAVEMITGGTAIAGRYFCVSFDDGFRSCHDNMLPITAAMDIPVIIYLPTDLIGLDPAKEDELKRIIQFYPERPRLIPFLNWEQCRTMMQHGISFGSHTATHANLSKITDGEVEQELAGSKQVMEERLGTVCVHFACPWGRPGLDLRVNAPVIAAKLGYRSFATTQRGRMRAGDDPMLIRRDHLIAGWENYQLDHFFGR